MEYLTCIISGHSGQTVGQVASAASYLTIFFKPAPDRFERNSMKFHKEEVA